MWSRAPLFRLAIAFFSGQYIYPSVPSILAYSLAIGLFFLLFIFHYFFTRIWSYHQRHQGGFLIFIMVLFWGMTCGKINEEVHLDFPSDSNQVLTALEITGAARERNSSIRYICRIVDTTTEDFNAFLGSSIWLYVKKDSSAYFKVGNTVCIENYPKALQGPQNPGEFDFREYSSRKGIYGMAYVQPDEIHRVDSTCKQSIFTTIRSDMLLTLDNSSLDHAQLGVIKALAMGYKDDLETDQREDFARAGAMHVLAVSGLHVGLIYMVLNAILRVPPGFRKLRIIKGIVVITFIWLYAGITDFSPSVLRSSTMFTFLVTGDLLGRRLSTLNSIAASAFFLVCLEPNIIHQLGFQLSYLAVCGIVIFHPFLASLIKTRFKIIRWLWDLSCVSMAAQLFTLPLTLFYFGHFPMYGIFANIVIIPLATGLLYSSLLFSLLPAIKWISNLLELIVDYLSYFMITVTDFVANLRGAQVNIQLSDRVEMILLLGMVITLVLFLYSAKKPWLMALGLCLAGLITWPMIKDLKEGDNILLCIHSFPKATCISIFGMDEGLLLAHEQAYQDSANITRKVECTWSDLRMSWDKRRAQILKKGVTQLTITQTGQFIVHTGNLRSLPNKKGTSLLIPHDDWKEGDSAQLSLDQCIVLDMSLSYRERNNWISALAQMGMGYWDVREQGALILTRSDIATALEKYPHTSPISSN